MFPFQRFPFQRFYLLTSCALDSYNLTPSTLGLFLQAWLLNVVYPINTLRILSEVVMWERERGVQAQSENPCSVFLPGIMGKIKNQNEEFQKICPLASIAYYDMPAWGKPSVREGALQLHYKGPCVSLHTR